MSYYFKVSFDFIKICILAYIAYKNPHNQICQNLFHNTLRNVLSYYDSLENNNSNSISSTYESKITSISEPILDESKDEVCGEGEPDNLRCIICMEKRRKTMIIPCNHSYTCIGCVKKIDKCPVCRQTIKLKFSYIN